LSIEQYTEKRALISAAGKEIGRLHRHGIFHGDLRVGNIIINGTGASVRLYFIDNERTRHYGNMPERKRFKNLVQLNMVLLPQITRTDRLRFFNAYLTENAALMLRRKEILRQIGKMTQRRYENKFR
jgi:tRNA A-37 threonylcarbamoyl transferase component Bud32